MSKCAKTPCYPPYENYTKAEVDFLIAQAIAKATEEIKAECAQDVIQTEKDGFRSFDDAKAADIESVVCIINVRGRHYERVANPDPDCAAIQFTSADGAIWQLAEPDVKATDAQDPTSVADVEAVATCAKNLDRNYRHNVCFDIDVCFNPSTDAFTSPDDDQFIQDTTFSAELTAQRFAVRRVEKSRHNALLKCFKWSERVSYEGGTDGIVWLKLEKGAHKIFGNYQRERNASTFYLKGEAVQSLLFTTVNFAVHDLDTYTYDATISGLSQPLNDCVVEGMTAGFMNVFGVDCTNGDGSALTLNGAQQIIDIAADRLSFTVRIYDARNLDTGFKLNPDIVTGGVVNSNSTAQIRIPLSQLLPSGGFNGKSNGQEAFINMEEWGNAVWTNIGLSDCTYGADNKFYEINRPDLANDRKMVFVKGSYHWQGIGNVVINGGEGYTVRTFGKTYVDHTLSIIGGTTPDHICRRGWGLQNNGGGEILRSTLGGYTIFGILVSAGGELPYFAGNVMNVGADRVETINDGDESNDLGTGSAVTAINGGSVSLNASWIGWNSRGALSGGLIVVTNPAAAPTTFLCNDIALSWRSGEGRGTATLTDNALDFENISGGFSPVPGGYNLYYDGGFWSSAAGQTITGYT